MAGPIRQAIDQASLERYLDQHVPQIKTPVTLKQFGFGQSNPTYQLTDSRKRKYVLRKKPPGTLLSQTAHQVEREHRILKALEGTDVPVPKAEALCEDAAVIGTAFYIMEFLDGRMFDDPAIPAVSPSDRRAMWRDAVLTLARLHRVRPGSVGLASYGRSSGFYDRQIRTFDRLAQSQGAVRDAETGEVVGQLPHFRQLVEYFSAHQPQDRGVLYHGDYKIDNLVFHKTEPRVIGILDWEMSTVGHPLADLANLIQPWTVSNATTSWPRIHAHKAFVHGAPQADAIPGLPACAEVVQWYEAAVEFAIPPAELSWATAFALFRDSVIFQGIAARHALRQASSDKARIYGGERQAFAQMSWSKVESASPKERHASRL